MLNTQNLKDGMICSSNPHQDMKSKYERLHTLKVNRAVEPTDKSRKFVGLWGCFVEEGNGSFCRELHLDVNI